MNFSTIRKVYSAVIACIALFCSASCVSINETLGENFIPIEQIWDVYPCDAVALEDITMANSDKLSGYSTNRITFGAVNDGKFSCLKSSSFTLVPLADSLDFGREEGEFPKVSSFHFTAVRDTLSMVFDREERILQNVYVYSLNAPLDSTVLYTSTDLVTLTDTEIITLGTPVYNGGDSLSFNFSKEYSKRVIEGIKTFQSLEASKKDSLENYLKHVPGIVITTDPQTSQGGRVNMFNLPIQTESGYITGNYAELKVQGLYGDSTQPVDTSFIFYFGPSDFLNDDDTSYPAQFAFNASINNTSEQDFVSSWDRKTLYVEGGSGLKPVIKAKEIKRIIEDLIQQEQREGNSINPDEVVINKATIILPYNVNGDYERLDKYPTILSPTVRLTSDDEEYTTYAGLTDSSIESEDQGDINRSLNMYCPDISHHVQEIADLKKEPEETDEEFSERIDKYDIWMLILHEEITETSEDSSYDDYYNNLMYNSYYNNMMYDPYGYGYGYGGYGGYGYGGYGYGGYGYDNYYNYYMMAAYANASSSSSSSATVSIELDKDRFYNAELNGPAASTDLEDLPRLKITFSAPKK